VAKLQQLAQHSSSTEAKRQRDFEASRAEFKKIQDQVDNKMGK